VPQRGCMGGAVCTAVAVPFLRLVQWQSNVCHLRLLFKLLQIFSVDFEENH